MESGEGEAEEAVMGDLDFTSSKFRLCMAFQPPVHSKPVAQKSLFTSKMSPRSLIVGCIDLPETTVTSNRYFDTHTTVHEKGTKTRRNWMVFPEKSESRDVNEDEDGAAGGLGGLGCCFLNARLLEKLRSCDNFVALDRRRQRLLNIKIYDTIKDDLTDFY